MAVSLKQLGQVTTGMPYGFVWSGGPEILNTNIDLMRTDAKRGNGHM